MVQQDLLLQETREERNQDGKTRWLGTAEHWAVVKTLESLGCGETG